MAAEIKAALRLTDYLFRVWLMHHIKTLDGLRGLAVLSVILMHSHFLPIGWVGVQMFFVLSGFLITSILNQERELDFRSFICRFYWRRALRIWPLYLLYIGVCCFGYRFWQEPPDFGQRWVSVLTYTYNWGFLTPGSRGSDYIGHLWSLCVEEQFYLIWPFVLFFLPAAAFRRLVVGIILSGPLIRMTTAFILSRVSSDPLYLKEVVYSLPTSHLDAFASGAFLAVAPQSLKAKLALHSRGLFIAASMVTILAGVANCVLLEQHGFRPEWFALGYPVKLESLHQYIWGYTPLNLLSAALILCLTSRTFFVRAFENRALVYVGKISYGIYVWHLGILHVLTNFLWPCEWHSAQGFARLSVLLATTLLVASVSYFGFEKFFLNMKSRPLRIRLLQPASATSVSFQTSD